MTESSRRGFLKYAGVGVAAAGAAVVVPSALSGSADAATPAKAAKTPSHAKGALVAHVDNVHGDSMTLMIEGREVVVHDKELVARLATHMHG